MKERIFTLPLFDHVTGLHVKKLVVEKEGPHVGWRHLEILMTFCYVSSSLADCTPGSDVTTGERCVFARVVAKRIGAVWLDSALVWNIWFAEVATNGAALVFNIGQGFERFNEPRPVLLGSPLMNWHVGCIGCFQFTQVKW